MKTLAWLLSFLLIMISKPVLALNCDADLNGDDKVGFQDLVLVIAEWNSENLDVDINNDGIVGFQDLVIVLQDWDQICAEPVRYVFASSVRLKANQIINTNYADQICTQLAQFHQKTIGKDFMAYLSSDHTSVIDRISSNSGAFYTLDERLVASNLDDFLDGEHLAAIDVTETDENIHSDDDTSSIAFWTGTDAFGQSTGLNCQNWSSDSSEEEGSTGVSIWNEELPELWASFALDTPVGAKCNRSLRLYCIQN